MSAPTCSGTADSERQGLRSERGCQRLGEFRREQQRSDHRLRHSLPAPSLEALAQGHLLLRVSHRSWTPLSITRRSAPRRRRRARAGASMACANEPRATIISRSPSASSAIEYIANLIVGRRSCYARRPTVPSSSRGRTIRMWRWFVDAPHSQPSSHLILFTTSAVIRNNIDAAIIFFRSLHGDQWQSVPAWRPVLGPNVLSTSATMRMILTHLVIIETPSTSSSSRRP